MSNDFVDQPLMKRMNKKNIISRLEQVESAQGAKPSAQVGAAGEVAPDTGEMTVTKLIVVNQATGQADVVLDANGINFANQEGAIFFIDSAGNPFEVQVSIGSDNFLEFVNSVNGAGFRFFADDASGNPHYVEITAEGLSIDSRNPNDGWFPSADTWTRTGNHTFTVAGDLTLIYRKGAKIHYNDGGGSEFGVIASSSHAAGTTTVNLIPNTDYAMAAATINTRLISYIENPESFPGWFTFAPTVTGWSGSPPASAIYQWRTFGLDNITFHINQPNNATSTTTTVQFSLPVTAKTQAGAVWIAVPGQCVNNGAVPTTPCYGEIASAGTVANYYLNYSGAAWTNTGNKRIVSSDISYRY